MSLGLGYNIQFYPLAPRLQQPPGDRSDSAVAYGQPVELSRGHNAVGRAGEERFVCGIDIVGLEVGDLGRNAQLRRQFQRRLPADARQRAAGVGRLEAAVGVDEEIAALVFGDVAVYVQEDALGLGIDELHLEFGQGVGQTAAVLDASIQPAIGSGWPG